MYRGMSGFWLLFGGVVGGGVGVAGTNVTDVPDPTACAKTVKSARLCDGSSCNVAVVVPLLISSTLFKRSFAEPLAIVVKSITSPGAKPRTTALGSAETAISNVP